MFPAERNPRIERVGFELRTTGVKPEQANPLRSGIHTRGYLPHVKREGARYFVTFRLADSMPASRRGEWEHLLAIEDLREKRTKLEDFLDRGIGECQQQGAGRGL